MADDAENYFAVKDIAKLFKDTKKKFNFKFNPDKNTLTFYPGKAYNSKDTGVTVKRNKVEAQWTASTASNRGTKVYIDSKKVNMTVYILNGTFYMKLIDIAKIADCAIAYSSDSKKVELNVNKPYNGEEELLVNLSKITSKVNIGSPDKVVITDTTGIIKPFFENVKLVKNPKTVEDFENLYKYMLVNNIMSCTIETNLTYDDIRLKGSLFDNAASAVYCIANIRHGLIGNPVVDIAVGSGADCKLEIRFNNHGKQLTPKELAKKNKAYESKINTVLQQLIDTGKLKADMTETQKAYELIKWVADNIEYDWDSYYDETYDNSTAYEALYNRKAICSGYTKLYNLLCRKIGLNETEYISGEAGIFGRGSHAWTAQVLDGKKVMSDATWFDYGLYDNDVIIEEVESTSDLDLEYGDDFEDDILEEVEFIEEEEFIEEDYIEVDYDIDYRYDNKYFAQPIEKFKEDHFWNEERYPYWK